ncbi:MAG TPA: hypothetical protein PLX79_02240 [Candidatus Dojkabacteria bacterium]|nr:hypothetical protein [Candidatus Dojkabacteria bacterium]
MQNNTPQDITKNPVSNDKEVQDLLDKLFMTLKSAGMSDEDLLDLGQQIVEISSNRMMAYLMTRLTEDEFNKWDAESKNVSELEMMDMLDKIIFGKTGEHIEEIHNRITIAMIKSSIKFVVDEPALIKKISEKNLTDEQIDELIKQVANGDTSGLDNL